MRSPTVSDAPPPPARPPARPNYALRRAVAAVLLVAVLLVVVVVVRALLGLVTGGGSDGAASTTTAPTTTAEPVETTTTTTAPSVVVVGPRHNELSEPPEFPLRNPPVRAVSEAAPLTIWTIGDSTAQALGQLLEANFANDPSVTTRTIAKTSSGLTRQDFYDWPAALPTYLAEGAPDAVVVSLGDNDAQPLQPLGSTAYVDVGSPEWLAEYTRRLRGFVHQLVAAGSRVYLVGQPQMRDATFDQRIAVVDSAFRAVAEADPEIAYVDSRALLGDDAGAYTDTLPDMGQTVRVRNEDGIHLSLGGARWMARIVGRWVAADYGVTAP